MAGEGLELIDFDAIYESAVRSLILAGLAEHWGTVDEALNSDLNDLAQMYGSGRIVVCLSDGRVVGTGTIVPRDPQTAEIVRMSVATAFRRAGVGRKVLGRLLDTADGWGMHRVVLETAAHWVDAVSFYQSCGFRITHYEDGEFCRDAHFERRLVAPAGGRQSDRFRTQGTDDARPAT